MDVKLHLQSLDDLETIVPLVRDYHAFEQLDTTDAQRQTAVRGLLTQPEFGGIWLIRCDGALAGYIVLCRGYSLEFSGFDAFIDELFLAEAFRGMGVGARVLAAIKVEARKLDINALHLEVARDNHSARKLYAAAGFEPREKYVLMSADTRSCE